MRTVKIHFGDFAKKFRLTILTTNERLQNDLFKIFKFEDHQEIYGFQKEDNTIIEFEDFLAQAEDSKEYTVLVQGILSGRERTPSSERNFFLNSRNDKKTFSDIWEYSNRV